MGNQIIIFNIYEKPKTYLEAKFSAKKWYKNNTADIDKRLQSNCCSICQTREMVSKFNHFKAC